jgi:hypothetical protein
MKKAFFRMTGLFALLVLTFAATAQTENQQPSENLVSATDHSGKALANNRVIDQFRKNFPGAVNESWVKTKEGFGVRFTSAGIAALVFLNRKGDVTGTIRYLTEKELPVDVRRQVKSTYYDYSIKDVKEVTYDGIVAYLVTVDAENKWKVIRVVGGDMDVYEEHTNG